MPDIAVNVARVRARIDAAAERARRRSEDVLLVAVTKTVPLDLIREGIACGLRVLGENRVQEARDKIPHVPGVSWHLIGNLQRNKVKDAVRLFDLIHSARVSGGNSATTTIRPAPHRGQTRVGVTAASRPGGGIGS